jgi:hypothetical protein
LHRSDPEIRAGEVRKITIDFAYVEFDSGRLAGVTANCTAKTLTAPRIAKLAAYKALVDTYASGASSEDLDAYMGKRSGLEWLKLVRKTDGMAYMLDQAQRVLQLRAGSIPGPRQ